MIPVKSNICLGKTELLTGVTAFAPGSAAGHPVQYQRLRGGVVAAAPLKDGGEGFGRRGQGGGEF